MPKTLQYSDSPNVETAFAVDSETGKKNRVVLTAAQDTSTLELPDNPNSTKGYVTIDGKKHRVILTADLLGEGGGGTIDTSKVVNADVLPVASADNVGMVYLYKGATDANYTHGYIYECTKESTYTDSVTFQPATLSGTVVTATAGALAGLCAEYITGDITTITSGTMTFDSSSDLWVFVGKDADNNTVGSFQVYQEDYQDAGFTFTGTPQDGDVVAFTCTITEASVSYAWTRVDVQPSPVIPDPLPSQTGNAGKFLTTDGTDASWSTEVKDTIVVKKTDDGNPKKIVVYNNGTSDKFTIFAYTNGVIRFSNSDSSIGAGTFSFNNGHFTFGTQTNQVTLGESGVKLADILTSRINGKSASSYATTTVPATMPELTVADWSSNTQTVNVTGVTASNIVFVSPAPASASDYAAAGIVCTAQGAGTLTFTCTTVPSNAITVNVVILG